MEKAIPIPDGETYHDWWIATLASKMNGIKFLNEKLVLYRQHNANQSMSLSSQSPKRIIKNFIHNPVVEMRRLRKNHENLALKNLKRLNALKRQNLFSEVEKIAINDAIIFNKEIFIHRIHLKRIKIGIKYRNYIFPNVGKLELIGRLLITSIFSILR